LVFNHTVLPNASDAKAGWLEAQASGRCGAATNKAKVVRLAANVLRVVERRTFFSTQSLMKLKLKHLLECPTAK
jgi:hypothetical protein